MDVRLDAFVDPVPRLAHVGVRTEMEDDLRIGPLDHRVHGPAVVQVSAVERDPIPDVDQPDRVDGGDGAGEGVDLGPVGRRAVGQRCDPMNPVAPVTRTRVPARSSTGHLLLRREHSAPRRLCRCPSNARNRRAERRTARRRRPGRGGPRRSRSSPCQCSKARSSITKKPALIQ